MRKMEDTLKQPNTFFKTFHLWVAYQKEAFGHFEGISANITTHNLIITSNFDSGKNIHVHFRPLFVTKNGNLYIFVSFLHEIVTKINVIGMNDPKPRFHTYSEI